MRLVPRLSRQNEKDLISALEVIVDEVHNKNHHPEDAVVKMVKEGKLKINLLPYVVYSYNNGKVVDVLRNGTSPLEKCAEFPVIKLDRIFRKLNILPNKQNKTETFPQNKSTTEVDIIYFK